KSDNRKTTTLGGLTTAEVPSTAEAFLSRKTDSLSTGSSKHGRSKMESPKTITLEPLTTAATAPTTDKTSVANTNIDNPSHTSKPISTESDKPDNTRATGSAHTSNLEVKTTQAKVTSPSPATIEADVSDGKPKSSSSLFK